MVKIIKITVACLFALAVAVGSATSASADVSIRDAKVGDLYVRDEQPSPDQLERQFAAFWNPSIGMDAKTEVSYNGPGARDELERVMQFGKTMDFFSIQGHAEGVQVTGDTMSVTMNGLMAGFPAQSTKYHYIRQDGLWKFDWKQICQEMQCQGDPSFGY